MPLDVFVFPCPVLFIAPSFSLFFLRLYTAPVWVRYVLLMCVYIFSLPCNSFVSARRVLCLLPSSFFLSLSRYVFPSMCIGERVNIHTHTYTALLCLGFYFRFLVRRLRSIAPSVAATGVGSRTPHHCRHHLCFGCALVLFLSFLFFGPQLKYEKYIYMYRN